MKRHCRSCLHYYVKDATIYTYIGFHSLEIGPLGETAKKVERYMGAYTRVQTLFGTTSTCINDLSAYEYRTFASRPHKSVTIFTVQTAYIQMLQPHTRLKLYH